MRKASLWLLPSAGVWLTWAVAAGADLPGPRTSWNFDVVHLVSGRNVHGLLVEENAAAVVLKPIYWEPGKPLWMPAERNVYARSDIVSIDRLEPVQRQMLTRRVAAIQADRARQKERLEKLELKPAPWNRSNTGGLSYKSSRFVLISNAGQDIIRRAATRLEELYAAYENFLPPRRREGRKTTILLVQSLAEYQQILKEQGRSFRNPAFYDSVRDEILCACDLERLGEELEQTRAEHQQILAKMRKLEADLRKQLGSVPVKIQKEHEEARRKILARDRENDKKFQTATQRLFQTLFHEAFHAYLADCLYPPGAVPRWLNEGLAQIFESAMVDAGELYFNRPDAVRLAAVKKALEGGELPSVSSLLHSDAQDFLVGHADERELSDRYYLGAWALAYYLTFDRRKLGSGELDTYFTSLKQPGADPAAAFTKLVGQPLPQVENAFHDYLRKLQPDGSLARLNGTPR
jgi:Protein of unknown function (DUF1570)